MTPSPEQTTAVSAPAESDNSSTVAQVGAQPLIVGAPNVPGYEIIDELGHGGMGVVYRARQISLNRLVALKMLPGGAYTEAHELSRFLAEAEAVAAVRHPHVVQVYESGRCDSRPHFAMEYLSGGSLVELIRKTGHLSPATAAALVEKLARGVQAAHDLGIVHRDLKPQNVLLSEDGEPKVADFGLAKHRGRMDLTHTGAVMGTPHYMAPEQAAGKTKFVGPAADIYALGVILYECLTGRTPFTAGDTVQLLIKVVEDEPAPVRHLVPNVPRDLEAICLKCLRKEPHARYATANELADDLRRFLNGEPVAARSTGVFGRVAGVLDRTGKGPEFTAYGTCLYWVAGIMLAGEMFVYPWGSSERVNPWFIPLTQYVRIGAFLAAIRWYRGGSLLPTTGTERQVWSLCGGYIVAGLAGAFSLRLSGLGFEPEKEIFLYQPIAALTALLFFSMGSLLWGWCYVFGLAFLAAGIAMAANLRFAPLIFGLMWAVTLTVIGARLRRLARESAAPGRTS